MSGTEKKYDVRMYRVRARLFATTRVTWGGAAEDPTVSYCTLRVMASVGVARDPVTVSQSDGKSVTASTV